jgi:hypothetical protein
LPSSPLPSLPWNPPCRRPATRHGFLIRFALS